MARNVSVLLLNLLSATTTMYGLINCTSVVLPSNLSHAGHKQFLTNIAALITVVNSLFNVLNQLLGDKGSISFLARELTLPVAMCLETIVCFIYWPLRLFFISLIIHGVQDSSRAPLALHIDISIHLLPILYLATDYFFLKPTPFQISGKKVFLTLPSLGLAYRVYLDKIIGPEGSYPYPFLDVAEPYKSIIFVVVSLSAGWIYILYQKIHKNPTLDSIKKQE